MLKITFFTAACRKKKKIGAWMKLPRGKVNAGRGKTKGVFSPFSNKRRVFDPLEGDTENGSCEKLETIKERKGINVDVAFALSGLTTTVILCRSSTLLCLFLF